MDTYKFILDLLNSGTAKLLIFFISVIAILVLFRKCLLEGSDSSSPSDRPSLYRHIHVYYICGILLLLLIQLGSYVVVVSDPKGETLTQYISFASTLSSLILSILAIIYTMISNSKGDTHVAKLEVASSKLTSASKSQMEGLTTILNSIEEFKNLSSELKNTLAQEIKQMRDSIDDYGKNFNTLFVNSMVSNGQGRDNGVNFETYLKQSSLLGTLAIYTFFLSIEKKVSKIPVDFFTSYGDAMYSCGYLIATASIFPIKLNIKVEDDKILFIHSMENDSDFNSQRCEELLNLEYKEELKESFNKSLKIIKAKIEKLSNKDS